jgi:hypothetical protein
MTGGELFILKSLFVLAIIGAVIGIIKLYREDYSHDLLDYAVYSGAGFIFLPSLFVLAGGLVYGIIWLFS